MTDHTTERAPGTDPETRAASMADIIDVENRITRLEGIAERVERKLSELVSGMAMSGAILTTATGDQWLDDQDREDVDDLLAKSEFELAEACREAFTYRGILRAIAVMIDGAPGVKEPSDN